MANQAEELKFFNRDGYKNETGPKRDTNIDVNSLKDSVDDTSLDGCKDDDVTHVFHDVDRGVWTNKFQFFLAIMGYTVGIGSVWRFPIICSRNGGGAFLVPFFFFLVTSGGPLYYLEVCLGQFTGLSAGQAFEYCPLFKGLGALQVTLSLSVLWYIMTILAWVFYFLYSSFRTTLPWTTCTNSWNTVACREISELWKTDVTKNGVGYTPNLTSQTGLNATTPTLVYNVTTEQISSQFSSSAYEFWEYHVIGRSSGLEEMGHVQLHLVVCLFAAWVFTTLAIINGPKTLGKVVYVTATAPFIFLAIMFIKGLTMDGGMDGIIAYLRPDFSKLLTLQVWLEAAIQVFYSLGPSWGGVITMSSYNKFHHKTFWSSTLCVCTAGFTSFFNGLVVFTLLGFMAKQTGMSLQQVASQSGPGLAFVAFPTILSNLPLPQLWSVLFFLMLTTVVFDSLFGMLETITSYLIDSFPHVLLKYRILVNIVVGMAMFLSGLPLTMNGGIYIFQLCDWYFSAFALLSGSLLECVSLCWIYGTDRFAMDLSIMTGRPVSALLRVMWSVVIPVFILIVSLISMTTYAAPDYGDGYVYSQGAITVGICCGLLPILALIGVSAHTVWKYPGTLTQRLKRSLRPSDNWCPNDEKARVKYTEKPYVHPDNVWRRVVLTLRGDKDTPLF